MTATRTDPISLDANRHDLTSLVETARQALANGDLEAARTGFEAVVERFPDEPVGHNNLGAFYIGLGAFAEAETSFERLVALLPDHPNCRFNLAMSRFRQNNFDAAAADFQAVANASPEDPEAWNNLGAAQFMAGDIDTARTSLRTALTIQPNYPSAVLNLCDVETAAGDTGEAMRTCETYLAKYRDHCVLRRMLEILDEQACRTIAEAIPHAEAIIAANEGDTATQRHLGRLLEAHKALSAES